MIHLSLIHVLIAAFMLNAVNFSALADRSCLDGNILIDDACYDTHFERAATYENAKEICEESDGQVALVHNTELQNALARLALKQKFDNYWIQTGNKLMSTDSCHSIMSSNYFEVTEEHCNNGMFYICEFDFEVSNSSQHGNKYFQLSEDRRKFTDALTSCSNIGGKLAKVDEDGRNFLTEHLKKDQTWERFSDWQLGNLQFGYNPSIWNGAKLSRGSAKIVNTLHHMPKEVTAGNCEQFNWDSAETVDCDKHNFFVCQFTRADLVTATEVSDYDWDTVASLAFAIITLYVSFLHAFTSNGLYIKSKDLKCS